MTDAKPQPITPTHHLTDAEREAFVRATAALPPRQRTLCLVLAITGCHISDALHLTAEYVDFATKRLLFPRKKKPKTPGMAPTRMADIPLGLLKMLDDVHGIRHQQVAHNHSRRKSLWPVTRMTAWRWVTSTLIIAGLVGEAYSPGSLRYGTGPDAQLRPIRSETFDLWLSLAPNDRPDT